MQQSKSCRNCESRKTVIGEEDTCMLSGYYCFSERKNPTRCGQNYENWQPRNPGFFGKLIRMFFMVEDK